MKLIKIVTVIMAAGLITHAARAVHIWQDPGAWSTTTFTASTAPRYTCNEFTLDFFGSYLAPQRGLNNLFETDIRKDGQWGGGVGGNYFFTTWFGIGGDVNFSDHGDFGGNFADYVMGSAIIRIPICNSGVAPYIFGGGGREFNGWFHDSNGDLVRGTRYEWMPAFGAGIEYRMTPGLGIFTDGRYMWHLKEGGVDRLALRAGLRVAF
jgi:hypothetical protein